MTALAIQPQIDSEVAHSLMELLGACPTGTATGRLRDYYIF